MKIGICTKCQKHGKVVMHHAHGYNDEHKDDVLPYCPSCHKKIHIEARKSGRCQIPVKELKILSDRSNARRNIINRIIQFEYTMLPNIRLYESITERLTGTLVCASGFHANNGKKLYYIDI